MIFWRNYLRVLLPLLIAFAAYQVLAVPFLEPTVEKSETVWVSPTLPKTAQWWEEFFIEGAWQRKSPKVIQTKRGILLFEEREQVSETRWRLKPLTILIPQSDSASGKRAVFIENPDGAEIQFKSVPDWVSGEAPPVVNCQMKGEIRLYSPPEDPTKDNGLLVQTRDLSIDKRKIWTLHPIKMQIGNSAIEGRDLAIRLDQELLTDSNDSASKIDTPFNGLDSLELIYVDRVQIGLSSGGLWPSDEVPNARNRSAYATLQCGGSFVFQFHQSQAIFKNGVHMEHVVEGLPVDTFDCNELKLQVGWAGKATPSATNQTAQSGSNSADWTVERVEATGAPSRNANDFTRWIKLAAPGMLAEAQGQHLVMDFLTGEVTLSNRLPRAASNETSPAYLRRESVRVWSPEVQYKTPNSILTNDPAKRSKRLGALLAKGTGLAEFDSKDETWKLSWGNSLLVRPDGDKDLVQIEGSANASSPSQGRFTAEKLFVWLTPVDDAMSLQLAPLYPDGKVPMAIPDRMHAMGDVIIHSPQIRAQVESMQVWFSYPLTTAPTAVESTSVQPVASTSSVPSQSVTPNENPATQPLQSQPSVTLLPPTSPITQPPGFAGKNRNASNNTVGAASQSRGGPWTTSKATPMNVTAKTLIAKVMRVGEETRIEDLNLEGNFTLTKDQLTDESPWPFTSTGEKLRISQVSQDAYDVNIVGAPATVKIGSGQVVAPELQLSQNEHQFWIDHPGTMVLPLEAMQKANNNVPARNGFPGIAQIGTSGFSPVQAAPSNSIEWIDPPKLEWGTRMTFDGKNARFGGGVNIFTRFKTDADTVWHVNADANELSLEMDKPVPLRMTNDKQKSVTTVAEKDPEIKMIRLENNVDIRAAQTDARGNRRSTEHMKIPRLDYFPITQEFIGHGPGTMWSRRLGNANPLDINTTTSASGPRATTVSTFAENNLQCLNLTFVGRVEGLMAQRLVTFYDRVEALFGPISDWEQTLDVSKVTRLSPHQSFLICDQLNLFDASSLSWNQTNNVGEKASRNAAWELNALGRVRVDSSTDSGDVTVEASRVTYAAKLDRVGIEGAPNEPARIYKNDSKTGANSLPAIFEAKSAFYRLRTGEFGGEIVRIEGQLPPNAQRPSPTGPSPTPSGPPARPQNVLPSPRENNPFQPRNSQR